VQKVYNQVDNPPGCLLFTTIFIEQHDTKIIDGQTILIAL